MTGYSSPVRGGYEKVRQGSTWKEPIRLESRRDGILDRYNLPMERKIFWLVFIALGLIADFILPLWWALGATIPILVIAWWIAYRSDWF